MTYYMIALNGRSNVDLALKKQGQHCYRPLFHNGKMIAQMEAVLDDLVDISYIESSRDLCRVLTILRKMGFRGPCGIYSDTTIGCTSNLDLICGCEI